MSMGKNINLKKIKSYGWSPWLERNFNPFMLSLFGGGMDKKIFKKIGLPDIELEAFLFENEIWYKSDKVFSKMGKLLEKEAGADIFSITSSLDKFYKNKKTRIKYLSKNIANDFKSLKEFYEILSTITAYIWLAHGLEELYYKKLHEIVPKYIKGDIDLFIGDASFPKKKNMYVLMEEKILKGIDPLIIAKNMGG